MKTSVLNNKILYLSIFLSSVVACSGPQKNKMMILPKK